MSTMVVGVCLGWAFGAAGMAAGLAARSQVLLAAAIQKTEERSVFSLRTNEMSGFP